MSFHTQGIAWGDSAQEPCEDQEAATDNESQTADLSPSSAGPESSLAFGRSGAAVPTHRASEFPHPENGTLLPDQTLAAALFVESIEPGQYLQGRCWVATAASGTDWQEVTACL